MQVNTEVRQAAGECLLEETVGNQFQAALEKRGLELCTSDGERVPPGKLGDVLLRALGEVRRDYGSDSITFPIERLVEIGANKVEQGS
jgi:hypothetical protein